MTLAVLLYHGVGRPADARFARWVVSPEGFAEHMELLAAEGYRTLTAAEVPGHLSRPRGAARERAVAVTFDDGFADVHALAWPHLRRLGLSATVFVTTGHVSSSSRWLDGVGEGRRPMLSWGQLTELAEAGIELGAHGHTHAQLDTISRRSAAWEIERSRDVLSRAVGPVRSFAYPHGYHTRALRRQVHDAGFTSAYAVGDGLASEADDRYAITRAIVAGGTTVEGLARILDGRAARAGRRPLRRAAWRALRRAGAEPLVDRLRAPVGARPAG